MKKKIALATLSVLPLAVGSVYASGQIGTVTATSLNVRSGAGTNYKVLFSVKKNEQVNITQTSNGWYKIKTSTGKQGWASADYIKINSTSSSNQSTSSTTKVVNTNGLNMRNGAGTSYRVITVLNKGIKVEVISESNGWSKIKYDGRLGYVASRYLDLESSTNVSTTKKEVNATSLNVRSGAGTNYSIIGKLSKGSKIDVISESNGWSKINYNGKIGYVSSSYLKSVSGSVESTPSITPTPSQPESTQPENINPEVQKITKEVNATSLNVRSGAGTNYSIIGKLNKGSKIDVISESNGWSKIDYNGNVGYVSSQYLSDIQEDTTIETVPPVVGGESTENTNGATINYNALNYTLAQHVNAQLERANIGANVINSSKPRIASLVESLARVEARGYINADKSDLEYFLNPDNFTSSKKGMMQFLRIDSYKGGITASELNSYLNSLKPTSPGYNVFYNQGQAFIDAAKKYDIDLVYLVAHAMWETGYGASTLAKGQTLTSYKGEALPEPVTVYNFFGIGAIDKSANVSGAQAAYSNGWTSIEATIDGSAKWIAANYVKSSKYNQNTIYKMKFNYDCTWHQYATDVNWANGISGIMSNLIGMYDTGSNLVFDIPQYK